jgi:hypothetical protein
MPNFRDLGGNNLNGVTLTGGDISGMITTGGTAQTLSPANGTRRGIEGQNISAEDLWINDTGGVAAPDTAGSYKVAAGESFFTQSSSSVSIVGASTGSKFSAKEV